MGKLAGTLTVPFVNEIAETHFAGLLHPDNGLEETEEVSDEIPDEDDTPAGYVEPEDPEKTETEDSQARRRRPSCPRPPTAQ
ncbi:hypothetical protein [Streptomyces sp. ALI-76-A]|uniref:hypothetical protein n=1 Tax=Streptomyces sp. ALI-76-A TaxID=3025736 RepID=UPI00256F511C|nr:hypothetical protein [Streptomyces sp. ALI-76-A]MDL5206569.1 hypothetical protein [Streptomyces sp. ALI-76-A]